MHDPQQNLSRGGLVARLGRMLLAVGPGIFCIGYTIGTGSVTSMTKVGSQFGMQLLWVVLLSCLFSWVLMEAYGRYAIVTGQTAMHSFRHRLKWGPAIAMLTIFGVVIGQWNALSGILGLSSHMVYEIAQLWLPAESLPSRYGAVLAIAVTILLVLYGLIWVGRYSFFEKVLIFFVLGMGLSFLVSLFFVWPGAEEIAAGLIPRLPDTPNAPLMIAALVGTTMAAPTFVVRPLLMQGKGWTAEHGKQQSRDALLAAVLMFLLSGTIMACAAATLFPEGKTVTHVLDMVHTLSPMAGQYAAAIFVAGTLSAGLSSIFPIMIVCPLLIADYCNGKLDMQSKRFRLLAGVACLAGLTVPLLGTNPIAAQVATQVANVFVLPVVIGAIAYLINDRQAMGSQKAGIVLNTGLAIAMLFSCVISYHGIIALQRLL